MDKFLFDRTVQTLLPEMGDPAVRKSLIEGALYGASVLKRLEWTGAALAFTIRLVRQLDEYGDAEARVKWRWWTAR